VPAAEKAVAATPPAAGAGAAAGAYVVVAVFATPRSSMKPWKRKRPGPKPPLLLPKATFTFCAGGPVS
jgi:hypothetical protein